jgi:hypothetical protein
LNTLISVPLWRGGYGLIKDRGIGFLIGTSWG